MGTQLGNDGDARGHATDPVHKGQNIKIRKGRAIRSQRRCARAIRNTKSSHCQCEEGVGTA